MTEIKTVKDLIPDSHNANKGTARGLKMVEASLQEDGFGRPVLVDKNGKLIAGNKTVESVAQTFGIDTEVVLVKTTGNKVIVHQREDLDLDDLKGSARRLAYRDNLSGHFSFELSPEVTLADFEAGFDFSGIGLEVADLAELLPGVTEFDTNGNGGKDTEPQIDKADELRQKWGVSVGQMWQLGEHRLICGDCIDKAVVDRVMGGERATLCVTDPPYMVNYDPQWRVGLGGGGKQEFANGKIIKNDDNLDWLLAFDILPSDVLYCWTADKTIKELQIEIEKSGFVLSYLIIWNKDLAVFSRGDYHHKYEPCLYMVRKGKNHNWQGDRKQETVWDIPTIHSFANGHSSDEWGLVGHGNQKPMECMSKPIQNNSAISEIIYDPFVGSGTTIIACENLGRKCRAIELDPGYVAVSLERFFEHTGIEPILID